MKIKQVSCTQFAGIRDCRMSFSDGINVVCGKNESGKSTLVNLIARTLFQKAKLDGRSDKEFRDLYFPAVCKGSTLAGDFADGKVSFEAENGAYTLSKEWGADARCTLSAAEGVIRDPNTIQTILKDTLRYGEGVYCDMLFSSQRNADAVLQTILDASKKTDAKQEITDAVSQAFAESDGISVDAIEQAIEAKIEEIAGKHWDLDRQQPVRKAGRWVNGLGEVLKAYYALEDAQQVLEELSHLELEAERTAKDYNEKDFAAVQAQQAFESFQSFAARLAVQSERKKALERIESQLRRSREILDAWPKAEQSLEQARCLQKEKEHRLLLEQYDAAKQLMIQLTILQQAYGDRECPKEDEIRQVKQAQRSIAALENKLCGMNLHAAVKLLNGHTAEVTSVRTGETIELTEDGAAITEAVKITVPGVMELQLSPADVNAQEVQAQLTLAQKTVQEILESYHVSSAAELEQLARDIADAEAKIDYTRSRLSMVLGEATFEMLEQTALEICEPVREKQEIEKALFALCGSGDGARFIAAKETVIDTYVVEHGSFAQLEQKVCRLEEEQEKTKKQLEAAADIPAEFLRINDPEEHLKLLQHQLKSRQELREAALTQKTAAISRLESRRQNIDGDPAEDVERARSVLEEQKLLLSHWLRIRQVFCQQKQMLQNDPMQDIADRFSHYLDTISQGRVTSEFPQGDRLNMNIYSANRLVDYGKLSEGTKDTVWLAFRLAVLDHLFPEGGGVIVFDDPFTDMDAERIEKACGLLRECAARHQVIFLTCNEAYPELLGGNLIRLGQME